MAPERPTLRLVARSAPLSGEVFVLGPGSHRVGRLSACDVVMRDASVSRIHARIDFDPARGIARIEDAESENGVVVNNRTVTWSDLREGDRVIIGRIELEVGLWGTADLPGARAFELPPTPPAARRRWSVLALFASTLLLLYALAATTRSPRPIERAPPPAPPVMAAAPAVATSTIVVVEDTEPPVASAKIPPPRRRRPRRSTAPGGVDPRLLSEHPRDRARAEVLTAYVRGDLKGARRRLDRVRSGRRELARRLERLDAAQARVRTELSNDPERARSLLAQLDRAEAQLLPEGVSSYFAQDLRGELADAFARRGTSRFEARRYDQAFAAWSAGIELDPDHAVLRAGLARIGRIAARRADEAELASQRGDKLACEMWRDVVGMTAPDVELGRRARRRAAATCR